MPVGPLYVLFGEVYIQVLSPFFNLIVFLPGVELYGFFDFLTYCTTWKIIQLFKSFVVSRFAVLLGIKKCFRDGKYFLKFN